MKRCSKCNREFGDELRFCLEDGMPLVDGSLPRPVGVETAVLASAAQAHGTTTQPFTSQPRENSANKIGNDFPANESISIGTAVVVGVALVVGLFLSFLGPRFWDAYPRRVPMIVVCLAGMVAAILRSGKHPTASLLAGLGLGLYLISAFVFTGLYFNLPSLSSGFQMSYANLFAITSLLNSFVYAIVIILVFMAVFMRRRDPKQGHYPK